MLKFSDYAIIYFFTNLFHAGIVLTLAQSWLGVVILGVTWEIWKLFENYRLTK